MPPPEQAPPAEIEAGQGHEPLLKQEVVVVSEAAGKLSFGKLTHGKTSGKYTLVTDSGSYQVEPEWIELMSSKVAVPRVQWPKWTQLSKRDPKLMLSQMSCNVEAEVGLSPEEWLMLPSQKS